MQENQIIFNTPVQRSIPEKVKVKKTDYRVGTLGILKKAVMPIGGKGWSNHLPKGETQLINGIDPQSCSAGGTTNIVETHGNFLYNKGLKGYKLFQDNLSERGLSIMMGMTGNGGYPWYAGECMRWFGALPEVFLPFDEKIKSLKEYFQPKVLPYNLFKICNHWSKVYDLRFWWVFAPDEKLTLQQKQERMMNELQYSPLGVAGYAWAYGADGKYYSLGPYIHWFMVHEGIKGDRWKAFDTYVPYNKDLDWNYDFGYCMAYSLSKKLGADDSEFNPDDAEDCHLEYYKYLFSYYFRKLIPLK